SNQQVGSGSTFSTAVLYSDTTFMVMNTENGCQGALIPVNVTVEACAGIPELASIQESLLLSPNPTTSQFIVSFTSKEAGPVTVKISDLQGKEINTKITSAITGNNEIGMNLEKAAKGTYLVTIEYKNHSFLRRIIKQ
ncbi:MAG: T9SS type A sorting domain-containing protein, partial [Crocinitomicaceae bacterium]